MPRLNDIPDHLQRASEWVAFSQWLNELPLQLPDKRELASIWAHTTETVLTKDQWRSIRADAR